MTDRPLWAPWRIEYITGPKDGDCIFCAAAAARNEDPAHQPIDRLGAALHELGALLAVDCVTSLGGLPVEIDAWGVDAATFKRTDPVPPNVTRSPMKITADGFFPSDRWRVGEMVRERFTVPLPPEPPGNAIALALTAVDPANGSNTVVLGVIPRATETGSSGSAHP